MFICTLYFVIAKVDFDHQSCMKGSSRGHDTGLGDTARGVSSEMVLARLRGRPNATQVVGIWWNRAKHRAKSIRI